MKEDIVPGGISGTWDNWTGLPVSTTPPVASSYENRLRWRMSTVEVFTADHLFMDKEKDWERDTHGARVSLSQSFSLSWLSMNRWSAVKTSTVLVLHLKYGLFAAY
jgi:hypothetical protein